MAMDFRPMPDTRVHAQRMVRPDVDFVVAAMFTANVRDRADRLRASLEKAGLNYALYEVPSVHRSISTKGGDDIASFLLGDMNSASANLNSRPFLSSRYPVLFFHDDWQLSRRLTLNLGVRWEPTGPWIDIRDRYEKFRVTDYLAGVRSQRFPLAPPGTTFYGDPGVAYGGAEASWNNVAPRMGFAWDVFGDGGTALKGGVSRYDRLEGVTLIQPVNLRYLSFQTCPWSDTNGDLTAQLGVCADVVEEGAPLLRRLLQDPLEEPFRDIVQQIHRSTPALKGEALRARAAAMRGHSSSAV